MFQSFVYFSEVEDKTVLKKVFGALKTIGRFLIEILNRDWLLRNFVEAEDTVTEGTRIIEKREFDVLTSRTNLVFQRHENNGVVTKKGSWRIYAAHEIKYLLEGIGFRFIGGFSNLERAPITIDTRLMRLALQNESELLT